MTCPYLRLVHPGREQPESGRLDAVTEQAGGGGEYDIVSGVHTRAGERDERAEVPLGRGA